VKRNREWDRDVVKITQSPMNALRWVLDLSCHHEAWVTRTRRPTMKTYQCDECEHLNAFYKHQEAVNSTDNPPSPDSKKTGPKEE